MGNLSEFIDTESETVKRIYQHHKQEGDSEGQRGYLGASIIGRECDRQLWYTFRNAARPEFSGRLYRLFETGNLAEIRFVKELRAIGCEVHEVDPATGQQFEVVDLGGHFSGHMDGCAVGIPEAPKTWHVLEFKTHNAKSFAKLEKEGVKKSKPEHYAQMMVYMGQTRMTRALYLAVNKDTDALYAERIRYDAGEFGAYMERAKRIITSIQPPPRITNRPDDWRCRFCDAKELCWGTGKAALPLPCKGCRTCCHATPELDGDKRWTCAKFGDLTQEDMVADCPYHLTLPDLIHFAEPIDSDGNSIEFQNHEDDARWVHGNGDDEWSTEELMRTPGPQVKAKGRTQVWSGPHEEIEQTLTEFNLLGLHGENFEKGGKVLTPFGDWHTLETDSEKAVLYKESTSHNEEEPPF